jgi:hypothetical protein
MATNSHQHQLSLRHGTRHCLRWHDDLESSVDMVTREVIGLHDHVRPGRGVLANVATRHRYRDDGRQADLVEPRRSPSFLADSAGCRLESRGRPAGRPGRLRTIVRARLADDSKTPITLPTCLTSAQFAGPASPRGPKSAAVSDSFLMSTPVSEPLLTFESLMAFRSIWLLPTLFFDALDEILSRPDLQFRHILSPGEFLVVDNNRVLHGRSGFTDGSGAGRQRCLVRVLLARRADPRGAPDG